jgi:hypothetical protein
MNATCGNIDLVLADVYFSMKEHFFFVNKTSINVRVLTYFHIMKEKILNFENPLFLYNMK